jgi:hypothetical protein
VLISIAIAFSCSVPGCAARHAPLIGQAPMPYAWIDDDAALSELRARARRIATVQATCQIVLTKPGHTVHLDGAMAARFPGQMRVRAWKLGNAIFDAAIRDGTAYMHDATPEREAEVIVARALTDMCELLGPQFIERADWERTNPAPQLRGTLRGGRVVACEVDRTTLAIRRLVINDGVEILVRDHREFDGMLWPTTIELNSPQGSILVHCTDVALNVELPDAAISPSARARIVQ